jgi:hypothetical protein
MFVHMFLLQFFFLTTFANCYKCMINLLFLYITYSSFLFLTRTHLFFYENVHHHHYFDVIIQSDHQSRHRRTHHQANLLESTYWSSLILGLQFSLPFCALLLILELKVLVGCVS